MGSGNWERVEHPKNASVVSHKWVFKVKYDQEKDKYSRPASSRAASPNAMEWTSRRHSLPHSSKPISAWFSSRKPSTGARSTISTFRKPTWMPEVLGMDTRDYVGLFLKGLFELKHPGCYGMTRPTKPPSNSPFNEASLTHACITDGMLIGWWKTDYVWNVRRWSTRELPKRILTEGNPNKTRREIQSKQLGRSQALSGH